MFSFFNSTQKKMRQNAEHWLEVADRVYKFRRDLLAEAQIQRLLAAAGNLRRQLQERAEAGQLKRAVEQLEAVLHDTGGRIYPASGVRENVEFFLVAALVILGLRAYFVQPFKIPTNSMWPSYYGMTPEVFPPGEEPGFLGRAVRLVTRGATNYSVVAPADGEVLFPVTGDGRPAVSEKPGRSLFIFPTTLREFTFSVGGQLATIAVPADFDQEATWLRDTFFRGEPGGFYPSLLDAARKAGSLSSSTLALQNGTQRGEVRVYWVPLGRQVRRGEKLASVDILTGDLLFVERLSYNFVRPQVGSGFVFKTENIHSPQMERPPGTQTKEYLIKRLVGTPGDTLEVRAPGLWRNGQPIAGAEAFGRNARREGKYPGYTNYGLLGVGDVLTVPGKSFYAMGDNSPISKDSRYWGFVPEKDVVGRPLFIYYPFTTRWGPAR